MKAFFFAHKPVKISFLETKEDTERKPAIKGLSKFLEFISYPIKNVDIIDKYDIRYITGGWFEEYVYYLIKDILKPTDIQIGVLIRETRETNMNDLDVVFTLGNKLFVIECKTGVGGRSLFSQIVYKASALKETLLGLSGKSYLGFLCRDGQLVAFTEPEGKSGGDDGIFFVNDASDYRRVEGG